MRGLPIFCEKTLEGTAIFDFHEAIDGFKEYGGEFLIIENGQRFRQGKWYNLNCDISQVLRRDDYLYVRPKKHGDLVVDGIPDSWGSLDYYYEFSEYESSDDRHRLCRYNTAEVFNVGHGNAIKLDSISPCDEGFHHTWFDYGCDFRFAKSRISQIANVLASRTCKKDVVVISHWDLDHCNCLEYLSKKVDCIVATNCAPRTKRRQAIIQRLNALHIPVFSIGFSCAKGCLEKDVVIGNLEIWRPSPSKIQNHQSLIGIAKNRDSIIFCGDQVYSKICGTKNLGLHSVNHLILSHHGGYSGKKPDNLSLISTGRNIVSSNERVHSFASRSIRWKEFLHKIDFTYKHDLSLTVAF